MKLVKFSGADKALVLLFRNIFSITPGLINTVGIIPVGYSIFKLNRYIGKGTLLKHIPSIVLEQISPVIVRDFINVIYPLIEECMSKNSILLRNFFRLYSGIFIIGLTKPFLKIVFRYTFGILFASLGVTLNEALSGIYLLKSISEKVLDFIPIIPFISNVTNQLTDLVVNRNNPDMKPDTTDAASFLSILGLIIIGASSLFVLALIGDYFIPDVTRSIPGVDSVLNSWYSLYDYVVSFYTNYSKPDAPSSPSSSTSEIYINDNRISRSISSGSSSSSSSTIQQATPRPTRPNSPNGMGGIMWPANADIEDVTTWNN